MAETHTHRPGGPTNRRRRLIPLRAEFMLHTCRVCGYVNTVYVNGSGAPKTWTCRFCGAVYEVIIRCLSKPDKPIRFGAPERIVEAGK